jgi:lysyl-tRNA synthetase class 2
VELALPLASLGDVYQDGIVDTGHQPQFVFLVAFLLSFGFIRTSAHLIRAQVSWWPGNVSVGGTHIHHLVWGILTLLIAGYVGVVVAPPTPWHEIFAAIFGIGAGLTLDEFALWLNLKDVYWSEQGRRSIDAVIVVGIISGLAAVSFSGWVEAATDVEDEAFALVGGVGAATILLAIVNAAKEKFGMAILGFVIPGVALVGAFRLAKPRSIWARSYGKGRQERAERRFAGSRGQPFWKRGRELLGRLHLGGPGGAGQN